MHSIPLQNKLYDILHCKLSKNKCNALLTLDGYYAIFTLISLIRARETYETWSYVLHQAPSTFAAVRDVEMPNPMTLWTSRHSNRERLHNPKIRRRWTNRQRDVAARRYVDHEALATPSNVSIATERFVYHGNRVFVLLNMATGCFVCWPWQRIFFVYMVI